MHSKTPWTDTNQSIKIELVGTKHINIDLSMLKTEFVNIALANTVSKLKRNQCFISYKVKCTILITFKLLI